MITKKPYAHKNKLTRSDTLFDKEIEEIIRDRYGKGLDSRPVGRRVIQRKLIRTPWWLQTKQHLKIAQFLPETDGQFSLAFNWFYIIIVAFMAVILFAGLIYSMGLINNVLNQVGVQNDQSVGSTCGGLASQSACSANNACYWDRNECVNVAYSNMSTAASVTFGQANNSIQNLRLVALTLIFSLFLSAILINFAIKIHPAYFFIYVLIVVLAIIFSAPISNAYQTLLQSNIFDGILPSFTGANYFMVNLPVFIAIGGILGGVFLFINIVRGPGEGGIR